MAGKKISKNAVMDRGVAKKLPGTPVRLISLSGATFTCPTCGTTMKNQTAYRTAAGENCSRMCAGRSEAVAEA